MPFSWMRVSSGTSRRIKDCMGSDHSKARFEKCVGDIVEQEGGRVEGVWFELNGKFAHVHVYWETQEQKANIVFDLEADQVTDLLSVEEADHIAGRRGGA
jgi:hypothetical protein